MSNINLRGYGDVDRVASDVKTLHEILGRQGTALFVDVLAEHFGNCHAKYRLRFAESRDVLEDVVQDLRDQTLERI